MAQALPELPLPSDELGRQLSLTRWPRGDGLELIVRDVRLVVDSNGQAERLQMHVTVRTHLDPRGERWIVALPIDHADIDPEVLTPAAFVVTIRANLEEWWDVRATEPSVAALGTRLS